MIDNHNSGYLKNGVVQLYVQATLGHYHILIQKEYSPKLMAQLKSTPLFTFICIIWTSENLYKAQYIYTHACKSTYFVLTD